MMKQFPPKLYEVTSSIIQRGHIVGKCSVPSILNMDIKCINFYVHFIKRLKMRQILNTLKEEVRKVRDFYIILFKYLYNLNSLMHINFVILKL